MPTLPTVALLDWFHANRRDLPWRRQPEPYRVWLSEVMAQQTRIDTMLAYYALFLERWPTVQDLAAAPLADVLAAWSGLGYYSRARNLHAAAQQAAKAGFPSTAEGLRALPGVGDYTAAAIASIAFGEDVALVDGNVERVLCRFHALREDPRQPKVKRQIVELAQRDLPAGQAGDYNQALMELGALLCLPRGPRCGQCPLATGCAARAEGLTEQLPNKPRIDKSKEIRGVCGALFAAGRVLMVRRPEGGLLGGLWELPGADLPADATVESEPEALISALSERLGLTVRCEARAGFVRHIFTHRKLTLGVWTLSADHPRPEARSLYPEHRWVSAHQLKDLGLSTLARKALELVGVSEQPLLFAAEAPASYAAKKAADSSQERPDKAPESPDSDSPSR